MENLTNPAKKLPTKAVKVLKQATLTSLFTVSPNKELPKFPSIPAGKEISIFSWNVNGLRACLRKNTFDAFIAKANPDILILNETKIDAERLKKEKLDSLYEGTYLSYFNCCTTKAGYSGTAIFTKYQPISVTYGINKAEHDDEGRVITAEFENFILVGTYVPNAGEVDN